MSAEKDSLTARTVEVFLRGNLSPLLILLSLCAGVAALWLTPREEEPQIVVPVADVLIDVPGASAEEVERLVATRLEKLLYQIDGVEYVYSQSRPNRAVVTVRFFVGEDREDSLLKLHNKLQMNQDQVPPQVSGWVVKPLEVDDVPILSITLYSDSYGDFELRRVAEELEKQVQAVPDTGVTRIIGGPPRTLRILMDAEAMAARSVGLDQLQSALQAATRSVPIGGFDRMDEHKTLEVTTTAAHLQELESLVVGVFKGRPIYLGEVASIQDGGAERETYTRISFGRAAFDDLPARFRDSSLDFPAVTLAVAKRKGANAVWVSRSVQQKVEELRGVLLPDGVEVRITRDHGQTANDKVNELLEGLLVAVFIVIGLLAMTLGWREALVVATAIPITFALTLLVNYLTGYSINRVTLFALILALGLVVDDPIVDVENIYRHLKSGKEKPLEAVLRAVNEVRPPIILATLAVMVSFLPMFFITGMMGPYMAPMALNVPLAMFMSLVVAFTITPWLSYHALKGVADRRRVQGADEEKIEQSPVYRFYSRIMQPLIQGKTLRWSVLGGTALLFLLSGYLAMQRLVPLKMLPFGNKDELQVVIDMPEGSTLEHTEAVAAEAAARLLGFAEVLDITTYVGTASPMDFNGMVRQYYLRQGEHVADLRINLLPKKRREDQAHALALRFRQALATLEEQEGALCKIVEPPPGPPVSATITVEVYGPPYLEYEELCAATESLAKRLRREPGACEVDTVVEARRQKLSYNLDQHKAALHGIRNADVARILRTAVSGLDVSHVHDPSEANPLALQLRLPEEARSSVADLLNLPIRTPEGFVLRLDEIGSFIQKAEEQSIYHKNLRRVGYVFAQVAGRTPAEVILDIQADRIPAGETPPAARDIPIDERSYLANGGGIPWYVDEGIELDWQGEGEWKITLDAFRDLGLAFAAACLGIYILLVHETGSYFMPLILMLSIPFTVIGIMPGFWLLNLVGSAEVAGVHMGIFFTATAMIGMIALSGIAVRNAILLIEFLRTEESAGTPTREALLRAGAVRLRPILLTAGTALLAALPITLDPIFSGLAWALIFGLFVSSAFTLVLVPLVYYMVYGQKKGSPDQNRVVDMG